MPLLKELRDEAARRIDTRDVIARVLSELVWCEKKIIDKIVGGGRAHSSSYGLAMRPYITARQNEHKAKRRFNRQYDETGYGYHLNFDPMTFEPRKVDYEQKWEEAKVISEQCKQTALAKLQEF